MDRIFDYDANGAESQPLLSCFYQRDEGRYSLDEERKRAANFFEAHHCAAIADPRKPTILIVGDLHAAHLFAGLQEVYGAKANLLTLSSVYCVPLVENVAMDQGVAGTPRCRAINDYVFDAIRTIKPDIVIVGGYFAQYDHEANWRYPGYLDALVAGARRLHADGVRSIIVAGQVPTWAPVLPILVGRDVLERGAAAEFSPVGVRPDSLETDRALAGQGLGRGRSLRLAGGEALRPRGLPAADRREPAARTFWPSTTAITAARARSSPSEPSSRRSSTRNWRGSERIDAARAGRR